MLKRLICAVAALVLLTFGAITAYTYQGNLNPYIPGIGAAKEKLEKKDINCVMDVRNYCSGVGIFTP